MKAADERKERGMDGEFGDGGKGKIKPSQEPPSEAVRIPSVLENS